jgi:hypothetical protein
MSRFLAKVAIESLAQTFFPHEGWNKILVEDEELNPLRNYARYGNQTEYWEYHQRRVYNETDLFYNTKVSDEPYEVLHEQNLVYLQKEQLYLVLILYGIEYAINLTNPKINGYLEWLSKNNNRSPIIGENERETIR